MNRTNPIGTGLLLGNYKLSSDAQQCAYIVIPSDPRPPSQERSAGGLGDNRRGAKGSRVQVSPLSYK